MTYSSDYAFEKAYLPPTAFSFTALMAMHQLTKAQAKRMVQRFKDEKVFMSSMYQANLSRFLAPPPLGQGTWISLKRLDKEPILQRAVLGHVMRALVPGSHGYELFPAQDRVVDTSNQFHVWTLEGLPVLAAATVAEARQQGRFELRELEGLPSGFPPLVAIRPSGQSVEDWRELQALKEADFPGCDAAMFHSATGDHALDGWLLVMPNTRHGWPLGWSRGMTVDANDARLGNAQQRPLSR